MGAEVVSYCEDCGLSSCYIRGGYCEVAERRVRERAKAEHLCVERWFDYYGWTYCWVGEMPENGSSEWIEVVW